MNTDNINYSEKDHSEAGSLLVKQRLARHIRNHLRKSEMTQKDAAHVLGMAQPRLSNLINDRLHGFSESKLMECLVRLGYDVEIVVQPGTPSPQPPKPAEPKQLSPEPHPAPPRRRMG